MLSPFDIPDSFTPFARNAHLCSGKASASTFSINDELTRDFLDNVLAIHFDVPLVTTQDLSNEPMFETTAWDMGKEQKIRRMFPGTYRMDRKEFYTNIVRGLWSFLLLGCFSHNGRNRGLLLAVKWKDLVTAERVGCFHIDDLGFIISKKLRTKRVRLI
jgi:hypothetical protein